MADLSDCYCLRVEGVKGPKRLEAAMESAEMSEESSAGSEAVERRHHQDEVLVEALAEGLNYAAAGELAHVSARTVRRRMADCGFATAVSQRRSQRAGEVTGVLVGLARHAVATLEDCLDAERPADRIRAAQVVLSELHRFRDQFDLEERLRQVEEAVDGGSVNGGAGDE